MIRAVFKVRISQFFRLLNEIGLFRVIFLLIILGFVLFFTYQFITTSENTIISLILIALLLLSVHTSRKDKPFLEAIIKQPYLIYLSEYMVLTLPVLVIWIVKNNWIGAGILLLVVFIIPLIYYNLQFRYLGSIIQLLINPFNPNLNLTVKTRLPFISSSSFEWISGIRRNLLILIPVYLLVLVFSFKPYVAVVGLIFLSLIISGFYFYGESREFVEFYAKSPRKFIVKKIYTNLRHLIVVFAPILIIALIFQISTWRFLLGALIVSIFIQVLTIIFKYSLFEENANLTRNSIIVYGNIIFAIVPYFLPVPIIMGIIHYNKALKNLKQYFHDQNK